MPNIITTCPACNADCKKEAKTCEKCGFSDRLGIAPIWLDRHDAEEWMDSVVVPYRRHLELQRTCRILRTANDALSANIKKLEDVIAAKFEKIEENISMSAPDARLNSLVDWMIEDLMDEGESELNNLNWLVHSCISRSFTV